MRTKPLTPVALQFAAAALALFFAVHAPARAQAPNLPFGGGPVAVNPVKVFYVYWLPGQESRWIQTLPAGSEISRV